MPYGLPAAAAAMITEAYKENRKAAGGILLSLALTSFLTGITEPIEFAFMFLAFPLYVLHSRHKRSGGSVARKEARQIPVGNNFHALFYNLIIPELEPNQSVKHVMKAQRQKQSVCKAVAEQTGVAGAYNPPSKSFNGVLYRRPQEA